MIRILRANHGSWHPSTFRISRPTGLTNYVLLIIHTHGEFQINNRHFTVLPNYAVIFAPGTGYFYGNPDGTYVDDYLHFVIEDSPELQERLLAICNEPFPIENRELFTFYIQQITIECLYGQPSYKDANVYALFTLLLNHLDTAFAKRHAPNSSDSLTYQLRQLRLKLENSISEEHSIQECANQLCVSESYFQYLYKNLFGVSFRQDLIRMRVEYVKLILITSNLPIDKVAEICGYTNEVHFYRQFKKITGITPAKFRKLNGIL